MTTVQAEVGDLMGARQTVALAVESAKGIEELDHRATRLGEAAQAQAEAGDVMGARQSIAIAFDIAKRIVEEETRDSALSSVAWALANANRYALARRHGSALRPQAYLDGKDPQTWVCRTASSWPRGQRYRPDYWMIILFGRSRFRYRLDRK